MRIRKQDANGDYSFGRGLDDFHINVPDAPALACVYRLNLSLGDWWLDQTAGTPWQTKVICRRSANTRDAVIRDRMLGTQGVAVVTNYGSSLDRSARAFSVSANLTTIYSTDPIAVAAVLGG